MQPPWVRYEGREKGREAEALLGSYSLFPVFDGLQNDQSCLEEALDQKAERRMICLGTWKTFSNRGLSS